jgi:uncharacterized NAD(P)/FAD-binding protein YdhS
MKTIAIIGGGFAGTAVAVNLLRRGPGPLTVRLFNCVYPLARGSAYCSVRPEHVLNVPVRNMSALADEPEHLLRWLQRQPDFRDVPEAELRERYIPRRRFGDYLTEVLENARRAAPAGVTFESVESEVVDLVPDAAGAAVVLRDGATSRADAVVLATGNRHPAPLALAEPGFHHPRYVENPWLPWEQRLPDPQLDVVMVGAGLTMVDACLTLLELGWRGKLISVSRSALPPMAYFPPVDFPDGLPADPTRLRLGEIAAAVERECRRARAAGVPAPVVVDRLRPHTQAIWRQFTAAEKQEFLRRYRQRWGAARHRIPADIHARITRAVADGRLHIVEGSVAALSADGDHLDVRVRDKAGDERTLRAGLVLNCTGPEETCTRTSSPLLARLRDRGLIQPDEVDLGLCIAPTFAVVGQGGEPSPWLYALGPLLRGSLWETVAVPEIRDQALRIATSVASPAERGGMM